MERAVRSEPQEDNRWRFWGEIPELDGRYLRVITLADKTNPQCVSRSAIQAMKLNYYPDTDSLYIDLSEQPSAESREISTGVVLDYDAQVRLVGIDIDNASSKVDLHKLIVSKLQPSVETITGWPDEGASVTSSIGILSSGLQPDDRLGVAPKIDSR